MPPGNAVQYLTNPTGFGYPGYSPFLGIVYRLPMPRPQLQRPKEGAPEVSLVYDDSALVMAMDVKRRTLDTVAKVATGSTVSMKLTATSSNTNTSTSLFPIFDDWAVMSDGTIAVLRGREYRVDFYGGEGGRTLGPRLSYPWKRVDDDERQRLADSINTQRKNQFDEMVEQCVDQPLVCTVALPVANLYFRHGEHEADRFGLEITQNNGAAARAFVKLQATNLAIPRPNAILHAIRESHPTLAERIEFANTYRPWEQGKPLEYGGYFRK